MLRLLLGLVGVELGVMARRAATTALLFVIGGVLLAGTVVALLLATFIALAEHYDAITAALVLAAICFIGAAIFLLIAYLRTQRRRRSGYGAFPAIRTPVVPPSPLAGVDPTLPPAPLASSTMVIGIAVGAALLGLILGRRI